MYDREKIEKTEKIKKKISSGCLTEIAALCGVKPNFGGGRIRTGVN